METEQKLNELMSKHAEYRPDFQQTLSNWEKKLKKAIAIKKFGDNDIIKELRKGLAKEIKEINQLLVWKKDLTESQRNRLFDKREMYMQFLNKFRTADMTIEDIDKAIDYELGLDTQEPDIDEEI